MSSMFQLALLLSESRERQAVPLVRQRSKVLWPIASGAMAPESAPPGAAVARRHFEAE